jgi:hypothetical protein
MPSHFKELLELKQILDGLYLPYDAAICTADATSQYRNIKTEPALNIISKISVMRKMNTSTNTRPML